MAVEIAILYFKSRDLNSVISKGIKGVDIVVDVNNEITNYEIKGTESKNVSFDKLKVSSKASHDALDNGMKLLRVSNVRNRTVNLYILEHGVHFTLVEEPRWRVKKIKFKP